MIYTLTFKCHGKSYMNSQTVPGKYLPNQYEAVACGLLLGKIELNRLKRDDVYTDLCLVEQGEMGGTRVDNVVWNAEQYIPISQEVK